MLQAYVLLRFHKDPKQALPIQEILKELRLIQGVQEAHALFGDIDGIALVEAQNPKLLTAIVQQMSSVPGIERTDTRIVVP